MYKFSRQEIDFDKYEAYLRYRPYIVFDKDKMEKTLQYEICRANTLQAFAIDMMLFKSGGRYTSLSKNVIINYLMDSEGCPERYFTNHKVEGYSLDAKKVLAKLYQNGHATEFIELYTEYKSLVSKNGKIKGILDRSNQSAGISEENIPLTKLFFNVNQQKNFRYNYKDSDIIAIPKEYNDCICVDDGYFLAWGDFAQSDFRIAYNLFMRSPENDILMNAYDDKYEALARMVITSEGKTFDYNSFLEERNVYKKLTLATVYGTRDSQVESEKMFIERMTEFLYKCKKYSEYEKRLKDRIDLGLPLQIDSYFGNAQVVTGKQRATDLLNDALNTPVQTGTSEIVALTTMAILEEFYKLGYTEEDISVYYVRHDEPVFRINKRCLKDCWVFNQFNQILIDDWTPLKMDFDFGYHYKKSDEKLTEEILNVYRNNEDKIVNIQVGDAINDFYPVPPVFKFIVSKNVTPDNKCIYTFYAEDLNAVLYKLLNSTDANELDYVTSVIGSLEPMIYSHGYRGISVKCKFLHNSEAFIGDSFLGFYNVNDNSLTKAIILGNYMYVRYCKNNNYTYNEEITPRISDEEFILGVNDLTKVLGDNHETE